MMKIFTPGFFKISSFVAVMLPLALKAQVVGPTGTNTNGTNANAPRAGAPFLTISPDSRSGAMGDAGVALSPDVNASFWNPAKLAYIEGENNLSLSYSPWLRRLVPDVSLAYLSYARKLDDRNTLGASLRYFNLGTIELVDNLQNPLGSYRPNEFSFDVSFARKFGQDFSLGLTGRYIYSNLTNGSFSAGQQTKPATAVAADASMYYKKGTQQFGKDALFAFGVDISNIGSKIGYTDNGPKDFLPATLRIGAANTWYIDNYNEFTFAFDISKLLVPLTITDSNGNVLSGDQSVPSGIFNSFNEGFSTQFKQLTYSPGIEYRYNKQFALRAGYFYQNALYGGNQYLTLGAGFKYDVFDIDFSYLAANQQQSPLSNTLRFSLLVNFGTAKKTDTKKPDNSTEKK